MAAGPGRAGELLEQLVQAQGPAERTHWLTFELTEQPAVELGDDCAVLLHRVFRMSFDGLNDRLLELLWQCATEPLRRRLLAPTLQPLQVATPPTLLHVAAAHNRARTLRCLLGLCGVGGGGGGVERADGQGLTPLMVAAASGSKEAVNELLAFGAAPMATDRSLKPMTAFEWAIVCQEEEMASLIAHATPTDQLEQLLQARLVELGNTAVPSSVQRFLDICRILTHAALNATLRTMLLKQNVFARLHDVEKAANCECTTSALLFLCASLLFNRNPEEAATSVLQFRISKMVHFCLRKISAYRVGPLRYLALAATLPLQFATYVSGRHDPFLVFQKELAEQPAEVSTLLRAALDAYGRYRHRYPLPEPRLHTAAFEVWTHLGSHAYSTAPNRCADTNEQRLLTQPNCPHPQLDHRPKPSKAVIDFHDAVTEEQKRSAFNARNRQLALVPIQPTVKAPPTPPLDCRFDKQVSWETAWDWLKDCPPVLSRQAESLESIGGVPFEQTTCARARGMAPGSKPMPSFLDDTHAVALEEQTPTSSDAHLEEPDNPDDALASPHAESVRPSQRTAEHGEPGPVRCERFKGCHYALLALMERFDGSVSEHVCGDFGVRVPNGADLELGRSGRDSRTVLAIGDVAERKQLQMVVREIAKSEVSNFCVRRLQDFQGAGDSKAGRVRLSGTYLLAYQRFLDVGDKWVLARDVCDWNLDEYLLVGPLNKCSDAASVARPLFEHMLRALDFLHRHLSVTAATMFHGNLKPSNVLIDCTATLRLVDFGFGRLLVDHGYSGPCRVPSDGRLHAVCWKPPEYYGVSQTYTPRSDMHSAGTLGHYMLTAGRAHPFVDAATVTAAQLKARVMAGDHALDASLGTAARHLLERMLCVATSERPFAGELLTHAYFH